MPASTKPATADTTTAHQQGQNTISSATPTIPQDDSTTASSRATGAGVNTGAGMTRPKTEAELEADQLYEEAMEEEYAKREGGA